MSAFTDWLDPEVIEDTAKEALEENGLEPSLENLQAVWMKELDLLWSHLGSAARRVAERDDSVLW